MSTYKRALWLYRLQVVLGSMVFGAAIVAVLGLGLALDALVVMP